MPAHAFFIPAPAYHYLPRDYAAQFERWIGYRLIPPVRRIIAHLECQRARRQPQRLFITSPREDPADRVLRAVLADYIRFRSTLTNPGEPYCVAAPKRDQLKPFLKKGLSLPVTFRKPEVVRGNTFRMAIILDADLISHGRDLFRRLWRSVVSCLDFTHHSLLIVLGTPHPRSRLNPFTCRLRSGAFPHISLSSTPSVINHVQNPKLSKVPKVPKIPKIPKLPPPSFLLSSSSLKRRRKRPGLHPKIAARAP